MNVSATTATATHTPVLLSDHILGGCTERGQLKLWGWGRAFFWEMPPSKGGSRGDPQESPCCFFQVVGPWKKSQKGAFRCLQLRSGRLCFFSGRNPFILESAGYSGTTEAARSSWLCSWLRLAHCVVWNIMALFSSFLLAVLGQATLIREFLFAKPL